MSHKSKKSVKSICAAKILAASEVIEEEKILKRAFPVILMLPLKLLIVLGSRALFTPLSLQRNSIHKSIRADISLIWYENDT